MFLTRHLHACLCEREVEANVFNSHFKVEHTEKQCLESSNMQLDLELVQGNRFNTDYSESHDGSETGSRSVFC